MSSDLAFWENAFPGSTVVAYPAAEGRNGGPSGAHGDHPPLVAMLRQRLRDRLVPLGLRVTHTSKKLGVDYTLQGRRRVGVLRQRLDALRGPGAAKKDHRGRERDRGGIKIVLSMKSLILRR